MESFLAALSGHRGDDATAKAQDVMTRSQSQVATLSKRRGECPRFIDMRLLAASMKRLFTAPL